MHACTCAHWGTRDYRRACPDMPFLILPELKYRPASHMYRKCQAVITKFLHTGRHSTHHAFVVWLTGLYKAALGDISTHTRSTGGGSSVYRVWSAA